VFGPPPHPRISCVGLNQAGQCGRFEWLCFIGWALAGDVCDWAKGWAQDNSQGIYFYLFFDDLEKILPQESKPSKIDIKHMRRGQM